MLQKTSFLEFLQKVNFFSNSCRKQTLFEKFTTADGKSRQKRSQRKHKKLI